LRDAALARRAADAIASDARRGQEKLRARGNAAAEQKDQAARRAAKKTADNAERAVHDLERKVAELRRALNDPDLYDGSAAKAKQAGKLDKELTAAQRALDDALARWAEVVSHAGRASTS
jgi:hypothetical protein